MNLMLLDAILWLRRQLGVVYAVMYCFDVVPPILFTKAVQRNRRKKIHLNCLKYEETYTLFFRTIVESDRMDV